MGLLKTSQQKYQHATIFIFVQVKRLQSSREIIPGNKHSHTVWLTFELQWFPWFHRQNHICCRSQLPYWWGRDPSRDPVSTEAATNCRQTNNMSHLHKHIRDIMWINVATQQGRNPYPLWTYVVALSGSSSIHLSYISSAFPNCCWSVKAWEVHKRTGENVPARHESDTFPS